MTSEMSDGAVEPLLTAMSALSISRAKIHEIRFPEMTAEAQPTVAVEAGSSGFQGPGSQPVDHDSRAIAAHEQALSQHCLSSPAGGAALPDSDSQQRFPLPAEDLWDRATGVAKVAPTPALYLCMFVTLARSFAAAICVVRAEFNKSLQSV